MNSEPYPWPFDLSSAPLTARRVGVVVSGWQRHWESILDWQADRHAEQARIVGLIEALRKRGATILWVRHGAVAGSPRAARRILPVTGSPGWALLPGSVDGDVVVDTPGFDAFLVAWTDLELRTRGLDRLVMCGLGTETAVSGSTRSANDRGYECLTATDAVVHHDPVTGSAQLASNCMSGGIFGAIGTIADLIADLPPHTEPNDEPKPWSTP